jgi:hypothetical protein
MGMHNDLPTFKKLANHCIGKSLHGTQAMYLPNIPLFVNLQTEQSLRNEYDNTLPYQRCRNNP